LNHDAGKDSRESTVGSPESKIENRKLEPDSSLLKASFRDNCLTAEGAGKDSRESTVGSLESKIENRKLGPDSSLLKASFRDNCLTAEGAKIAEEGREWVKGKGYLLPKDI